MGDRWDDLAGRMVPQDFKLEWGGRITIHGDNRPAKQAIEDQILYGRRPDFVPVSERLRLHYIEGAHAGLRGEWARTIREETAMLADTSRCFKRALRDGTYLFPADEEIPF